MSFTDIHGLNIKVAKSILEKARGLMFRRKVDYALLIPFIGEPRKTTIHSFFVFFDFHAVFLDEEKRVVDIKKNISPFKGGITPDKPAKYVLEIPKGEIDIEELSIGERLEIEKGS